MAFKIPAQHCFFPAWSCFRRGYNDAVTSALYLTVPLAGSTDMAASRIKTPNLPRRERELTWGTCREVPQNRVEKAPKSKRLRYS